jgi:putative ABC transport system permease protein
MAPRVSYADYLTTNQNFISVVGRLRDGATVEGARSELASVERQLPSRSDERNERRSATALSLNDARVDPTTRAPMLVLLGSVACLLLLACANVAGLLLGRAVGRRQEIAIRVASGASRARIVRQLLVESALLAFAGGAVGVLAAIPVTSSLGLPSAIWRGRNMYGSLGEFADPRVDVRVLLFAAGVCALTTLVFGLAPALRATRGDLVSALKDGGAGSGASSSGARFELRQVIVGGETALATVLLVAGALLASSWLRLENTSGGFDREHLLTFLIRPSEIRYPPSKAPQLIDRVIDEIERVPGVEAASVDGCAPMSTGCANSTLFVVGRPADSSTAPPVLRHYVGADHFRTLRVPTIRGRVFSAADRAGSNRVAIINETAARRFWPDADPIGQRVWFGGGSNFDRPDSSAEIVGIVGDVAYQAMDDHPVQADFYTPYAQFSYASRMVLVRTRGDPAAMVPDVRHAVRAADPSLALFEVQTMNDRASGSWARITYQARIISAFAIVALLLAAVGIFAIIAHLVGDRRRDIGIRIALGASATHVLRAVGSRGARPAALGVAVGAVGALAVGRVLSSAVFGVRALDIRVLGGAAIAVMVVSVFAAWLSARRALRIEPLEALR